MPTPVDPTTNGTSGPDLGSGANAASAVGEFFKNANELVANPLKPLAFVAGLTGIYTVAKGVLSKISDASNNARHKNHLESAALRDIVATRLGYENVNQMTVATAFLASCAVLIAKIGLYLNLHLVGTVLAGVWLSALAVVVINSALAKNMSPVAGRNPIYG